MRARMVAVAVPGEQQRGEQPDEDGEQEKRHGANPARSVAAVVLLLARAGGQDGCRWWWRHVGRRLVRRWQVRHHADELSSGLRGQDKAEALVQFLDRQPSSREVVTKFLRGGVTL